MPSTDYALHIHLDLPYDLAIEHVTAALKTEGFGILTRIDMQATLKQKLDVDFRRYVILGACNPPLAHRALTTELDIGLLLPCNVIVYEADGSSEVAIADPIAMLAIAQSAEVRPIAEDALARLQRVITALETSAVA